MSEFISTDEVIATLAEASAAVRDGASLITKLTDERDRALGAMTELIGKANENKGKLKSEHIKEILRKYGWIPEK